MAKVKQKPQTNKSVPNWRTFHKIQVHHNRWLFWAIAAIVLVSATLIGYIQVTDINFQTQMEANQLKVITSQWATFTHKVYGYSFKYPRNWGLENDADGSISFVDPNDSNSYITVSALPLSEKQNIQKAVFPGKTETFQIAGHIAIQSAEPNQTERVIMLNDSNQVYVIRGQGPEFGHILATFKLRQTIE